MEQLNFENFYEESQESGLKCELVAGSIVQSAQPLEEGRKVCFFLGTLMEDYVVRNKTGGRILFQPELLKLDEDNYFQPDLILATGRDAHRIPEEFLKPTVIVEVMPLKSSAFSYVEKAFAYKKYGAKEYWILDMDEQMIYTYNFMRGIEYSKTSFERTFSSEYMEGFFFNCHDIIFENGGSMKELALFSKYKRQQYQADREMLIAETQMTYGKNKDYMYTASAFYKWLETRKNMTRYSEIIELFMGEIRKFDPPFYSHQHIQGNLYYEINHFLRDMKLPYKICFFPISVELSGKSPLDSVVIPDLFMIPEEELFVGNVYVGTPKWIIEITTPQSAGQDYVDKAQLYQYYGVEEYWIINEWKKKVLVIEYHMDEGDSWDKTSNKIKKQGLQEDASNFEEHTYEFEDSIPVKSLPGLEIKMKDIV